MRAGNAPVYQKKYQKKRTFPYFTEKVTVFFQYHVTAQKIDRSKRGAYYRRNFCSRVIFQTRLQKNVRVVLLGRLIAKHDCKKSLGLRKTVRSILPQAHCHDIVITCQHHLNYCYCKKLLEPALLDVETSHWKHLVACDTI